MLHEKKRRYAKLDLPDKNKTSNYDVFVKYSNGVAGLLQTIIQM